MCKHRDDDDPWVNRIRLEVVARNASRPDPLPLCADCKFPFDPRDAGWLYPRYCECCDGRKLDRVLWRAARKIGTGRLRRLLKTLAK
jgi:hypothetical protein